MPPLRPTEDLPRAAAALEIRAAFSSELPSLRRSRYSFSSLIDGFGTTNSKSRLNFLALLRAGHTDYVINDAALSYMRERALAEPVIARLAAHTDKRFADPTAWQAHLEQLGITQLAVTPNPMQIATEGALWGSIQVHGFLHEGVIVSDDAGQFAVGNHALCWIHAERLVHKLDTLPTTSVPPSSLCVR